MICSVVLLTILFSVFIVFILEDFSWVIYVLIINIFFIEERKVWDWICGSVFGFFIRSEKSSFLIIVINVYCSLEWNCVKEKYLASFIINGISVSGPTSGMFFELINGPGSCISMISIFSFFKKLMYSWMFFLKDLFAFRLTSFKVSKLFKIEEELEVIVLLFKWVGLIFPFSKGVFCEVASSFLSLEF